jgi:hypothetical protein
VIRRIILQRISPEVRLFHTEKSQASSRPRLDVNRMIRAVYNDTLQRGPA